MAILTPTQIERLKKILEDASKALAVASLDHQLTTTEVDRLVAEGYLTKAEALNIIEGAYKHGAILTRLAEAGTMNVEQFQEHLKANPLAMSPVEKLAFENARDRAGTFCVGLGNRWSDKLGAIVINADADLANRMRENIKSTTAVAIAKRKTAQELRSDLRQLTKDYTRDWDRIAQTEIQQAHQEGYIEQIREEFGDDELLAKIPEPDACFIPGTAVLTRRGNIPIEDVVVGDEVLTHKLRWKKVTGTPSRSYSGKLIGINGEPSSTAEHPYLESMSWRRADSVKLGDEIVQLSVFDPDDKPSVLSKQPLLGRISISGLSGIVPAASVDLYRNLQALDGDIDVEWPDGVFRDRRESAELAAQALSLIRHACFVPLSSARFGSLRFRSYGKSPCESGILCKLAQLFFGHLAVLERQRLLEVSSFDSVLPESFSDGSGRNAILGAQKTSGLAAPVLFGDFGDVDIGFGMRHESIVCAEARKVNRIDTGTFSGTVFNLEVEEDQSYFANGIAVHNCKHCIRHYTKNGAPIIRPASWWAANGVNNVGRKTADWKPVIGTMHPWCRCRLQRIPKGWGVTMDGELLPPGVEKSFSDDPISKAYKLQGRRKWHGLDISIENKKGSVRKWYDSHAKREGSTKMHFAYGYVKGSLASDGDHCDVYLGPDETATNVYVIHQMKAPDFKVYDEDKSMLQFKSAADAKAAYLKQYDNPKFFGSMTTMSIEEFKKKVLATRGKPAKQRMLKSLIERGDELMAKSLAGISLPDYAAPNRSVGSGTFGFHQDETKKTKNKGRGVSTVIKQQNFKGRVKELLAGYESHPPRVVLDFKLLDPSLFDAMGGAGRPPIHKRPWETVQGEHLKLNVVANRERLDIAISDREKAQEQARATARWSPDIEAD
jgi:hypothetical protein